MQQQKVTNTTSAMMTYCGFNSHSVSWDVFFIFSCSSKLPSSVLSNIFIITFADRQRNQILLKFLLITGFCKKGHRCSCADAPKYQSAVLPSVIIDQTSFQDDLSFCIGHITKLQRDLFQRISNHISLDLGILILYRFSDLRHEDIVAITEA